MVTSRGAHLPTSLSTPYDDSQKTETQCPALTARLNEDFPGSGQLTWGCMNLRFHMVELARTDGASCGWHLPQVIGGTCLNVRGADPKTAGVCMTPCLL